MSLGRRLFLSKLFNRKEIHFSNLKTWYLRHGLLQKKTKQKPLDWIISTLAAVIQLYRSEKRFVRLGKPGGLSRRSTVQYIRFREDQVAKLRNVHFGWINTRPYSKYLFKNCLIQIEPAEKYDYINLLKNFSHLQINQLKLFTSANSVLLNAVYQLPAQKFCVRGLDLIKNPLRHSVIIAPGIGSSPTKP